MVYSYNTALNEEFSFPGRSMRRRSLFYLFAKTRRGALHSTNKIDVAHFTSLGAIRAAQRIADENTSRSTPSTLTRKRKNEVSCDSLMQLR